jgi:predicted nucleic acid-binding protein
MTDLVFADTNILIYEQDAAYAAKQSRAHSWIEDLWRSERGRTSFQVLQEFYATATQRLKPGLTRAEARETVQRFLQWRPVMTDARVLAGAFVVQDRFAISFWDALIVSAAQAAGCSRLLTEDLQDGQDFDGLVVVNPFRHRPDSI